MKKRVLLLEDDITLNDTISDYLQEHDFEVFCAFDGEEANALLYEHRFDLLLLDVNVPSLSGFDLLLQNRKNGIKTPAVFITSLNSMDSFEKGFDSGCDDYIRKPFELKELLIRIQAIIKRGFFHENSDRVELGENIAFDTNNAILYENEKPINLKLKELKLLKLFLQHQNELLSHERIYEQVWEYDEEPSDTSLRTYIKNLRKILGKDRITSVKKLGYRFESQ
jgi:DNA-binding response OmpR family regulator